MAPRQVRHRIILLFSILPGTVMGCGPRGSQIAPQELPVVPVSHPVQRQVTDYVDFTGRTEAVHSVNIIARVTGYLVRMPFQEGADVKAGDLLFEIDPRPYQAQLDQAQSQVSLYAAQLDLARKTYDRYKELDASKPGAVSKLLLDQYKAQVVEAEARVQAFQKSLEVYKLNKEFTQVVSPIDGQVSRYYLTLGNLVNQDQTLLTTVVSPDPIYAYFDMDERTLLRIRRAINEGKIKPRQRSATEDRGYQVQKIIATMAMASTVGTPSIAALGLAGLDVPSGKREIPLYLGLPGEEGFPHRGEIDFANNQINPGTGSISVRGVFANPKPYGGVRLMSPGMFVRIRLPIGSPHPALLVIDRAIQSDQGQKYVYVIDADKKADYRRVTTGALEPDGLRVITDGLKPDDWVVVGAMQQVRPNMEIRTQEITMPSFGPQNGGPPAAGSTRPGVPSP